MPPKIENHTTYYSKLLKAVQPQKIIARNIYKDRVRIYIRKLNQSSKFL